jgi:outer membrane protein assembly factor BamB
VVSLSAFPTTVVASGAALWATQLPGYWYDASPNAYGGIVFISGNGGLSAVDETNGNIIWTNTTAGTTDWASPAIASEGAFMESGSCQAGGYEPSDGAAIWQASTQCSGAFGHASSVKNGVLFGRTSNSLNLLDASTGNPEGQLASAAAPAVTSTAVIALNAGTLSSTRLSDLVQTWTFIGDGTRTHAAVRPCSWRESADLPGRLQPRGVEIPVGTANIAGWSE